MSSRTFYLLFWANVLTLVDIAVFSFMTSPKINKGKTFRAIMSIGSDIEVDVAVLGGGIAGTSLSWLLQEQHNCKVALVDPRADVKSTWYPNYGEWRDEWHALSEQLKLPELKSCTTTEWEITDCFFGGSFDIPTDARLTLPRPYIRVDRIKMQALLRDRFAVAGGLAVKGKVSATRLADNLFDHGILHHSNGSTISLDDGQKINCKVIIDATGLESRLIARETPQVARWSEQTIPIGYQIAYGFIAHVNSLGPYDEKAMTLFDYRNNIFPEDSDDYKQSVEKPTFMYTMPLSKRPDGTFRVFFEETSLVGRGERRLSFEECKRRAYKRLAFHDIQVLGVEEEEFCYIPMGGELPDLRQRIVGFGGAANIVHPSTGYQACRMLAASTKVASVIEEGLRAAAPPDQIAANAYKAMWSRRNRLQRDFQAFGGDFLMAQPVTMLRGFFSAFFAVEQPVWSGFLAGWPGLPNNEYHDDWTKRITFALKLFVQMPTEVKVAMILFAIKHTIAFGPNTLLRSLLPDVLFGPSSEVEWAPPGVFAGDVAAKDEARAMMQAFSPSGTAVAAAEEVEEEELIYPSPF